MSAPPPPVSAATPRAALLRAIAVTRPERRRVAASVLLAAGAVGAAMALLATSGYLISRAAERPPILLLSIAIVGVRVFGVARALLRYAERLVSHDLAFRVLAAMRLRFFGRLVPLAPADLRGMRGGDLLSRFVADVDQLQELHLRGVAPPLVAAVTIAGASAAAFLMLPAAGAALLGVLLTAAVALPLLTFAAGRRAGRRQAPARAALTAELVDVVRGAPELAVAGREDDAAARVAAADARLARAQRRDALAGGVAAGASAALAAGAAVAVLAASVGPAAAGELDGVLLAALALLALASFEGVAPLGAAAQHLEASAHAAARLETVTGAAPSIADPPLPAPLPAGAAALEDVSARFPGATGDVLRGVSLAVAPGRAVALVGPSGAGKTTVANLLARFLDPVAGRVTLGGADVRTGAQDDLRARVRLVEQDAHLFATSVRANVALARPGATDGEIAAALRAAGLGAWLETLPDGLATLVGEHGAQVSGGQRSRIAAARALLCDAEILVVDEPGAHLDPAGARELLHRLAAERDRGRGVLVISHATDGLDAFDEVVVLEDGRVAERGTHAALLARDGRYAGLASASASPSPSPA